MTRVDTKRGQTPLVALPEGAGQFVVKCPATRTRAYLSTIIKPDDLTPKKDNRSEKVSCGYFVLKRYKWSTTTILAGPVDSSQLLHFQLPIDAQFQSNIDCYGLFK